MASADSLLFVSFVSLVVDVDVELEAVAETLDDALDKHLIASSTISVIIIGMNLVNNLTSNRGSRYTEELIISHEWSPKFKHLSININTV